MSRGLPDYQASNAAYGQQLTDVGELAARVGSIDTYERKGQVFYITDFSDLLKGWQKANFDLSEIWPVTNRVMWGSVAARIFCDHNSDQIPHLSKRFPLIDLSKIGMESPWQLDWDGAANPASLMYGLAYFNGTTVYTFYVRYQPPYGDLMIYVPDPSIGNWYQVTHTFGKTYLGGDSVYYNYIKLVVDLDTLEYDHLILNTSYFNLKGFAAYPSANNTAEHIEIMPGALAGPTDNYVYYGGVILTMNEP
jgi:hypothetical protein